MACIAAKGAPDGGTKMSQNPVLLWNIIKLKVILCKRTNIEICGGLHYTPLLFCDFSAISIFLFEFLFYQYPICHVQNIYPLFYHGMFTEINCESFII